MLKQQFLLVFFTLTYLFSIAQNYTRQDTLRGSITEERNWWDLKYYHLDVKVDLEAKKLQGTNLVQYKVLKPKQILQIDLQEPMVISEVKSGGKSLKFNREGNVYFIELAKKQVVNEVNNILISFEGTPRVAPYPPWDPGMVWKKDSSGNHFASSVCWGLGSSLWWPCKDHLYDEVDSMAFSINVPRKYIAVGNGRLKGVKKGKGKTKTYTWFVKNPINNYGVNFNIAKYANFSEKYQGEKGVLDCNYYVLEDNLKKAKKHFKQVPMMLEAFEYWFGPYPFYEDSYKLVEVPYWGMEHQSATAYGNDYLNGCKGEDASKSGWGDKFDYILVHESGHEWFACNVTFKDFADIWIHEGFTTYSEGLYVEYHFGKEAGNDYQLGIRKGIRNNRSMIGDYDVNDTGYSSDNYYKGAAILHMLRQIVDDDKKWREILRGINRDFYHQTTTSKEIENYISTKANLKLDYFWDQYLRTTDIPVLEYYFAQNQLYYRWTGCNGDFEMPLKVELNGKTEWIQPKIKWQKKELIAKEIDLKIDRNFYVPVFYSNANVRLPKNSTVEK